jgi:hypothetical protein
MKSSSPEQVAALAEAVNAAPIREGINTDLAAAVVVALTTRLL